MLFPVIIRLVNNLANLFPLPFFREVLLFEHFSSLEDFSYFDKLQSHGISHRALFLLGQVLVSPAKNIIYVVGPVNKTVDVQGDHF